MKRIVQIVGVFLAAALVLLVGNIWASANWLTVRNYKFETGKAEEGVRVVVLSDLHNHEFGRDNKMLVRKVWRQEPDLILLDGDFINEDSGNADVLLKLTEELSHISPVYFSPGNHEMMYMEEHGGEFLQQLETAGAEVLEKHYVDLDIRGTKLRLGGMYEYAFGMNGEDSVSAVPKNVGEFLRDFENTDRIKIMMAHRPDSFIFGDAASYWNVDLVVSGHDHGGQVVVPFKGGFFGGDQGWFPEYVHGMYEKEKIRLFVTSGLGSCGQKLPRLNNRPEIAVISISGTY